MYIGSFDFKPAPAHFSEIQILRITFSHKVMLILESLVQIVLYLTNRNRAFRLNLM